MKRTSPSILLLLVLLTPFSPAAAAAPVKARPLSGVGVLVMQSTLHGAAGETKQLQLYREPMMQRLALLPAGRLPKLAPYIIPAEGVTYAIVISTRPGWLCLLYDDAERGGWVERRKSGEFFRWREFLAGRSITMLPGIGQEHSQLRGAPSSASPQLGSTGKNEPLTVVEVEGDWVRVSRGNAPCGWLRWRDGNSRLLVTINMQIQPLKR